MPNKSLWSKLDLLSFALISYSCILLFINMPFGRGTCERYPSAKLNLSKIYMCRILECVANFYCLINLKCNGKNPPITQELLKARLSLGRAF